MSEYVAEILVRGTGMSAYGIGHDVLVEGTERGYAHVRRVHACHKTCTRRCRHRTCVGIGKHGAPRGQAFHVRGMEHPVVSRHLVAERQGCFHPAEIVDQKKYYIRALLLCVTLESRGQRKC